MRLDLAHLTELVDVSRTGRVKTLDAAIRRAYVARLMV
jgi:hypothetical protein